MDVIEKAKELAMAIAQDERCVRLQSAKALNETDTGLQELLGKFNLKKMMLSAEYKKVPLDDAKLKTLEEELRGMYADIMANPRMTAFNDAKKDMDDMLSHVNSIIQVAIDGEAETGGCTGSCESCHGCQD